MNQVMPKHAFLPNTHVVLGFDFGSKKMGVAVGQTITGTASPLVQLDIQDGEPDWEKITALISEYKPFAFIVGHPIHIDGSKQVITLLAENFAKLLKAHYDLPVYSVDERLSTVEARRELFEQGGYRALSKKNIDMKSAQIILQEWLDRRQLNG